MTFEMLWVFCLTLLLCTGIITFTLVCFRAAYRWIDRQ